MLSFPIIRVGGGGPLEFLSASRKRGGANPPPPQHCAPVNLFVATHCCTSATRASHCMPTRFN